MRARVCVVGSVAHLPHKGSWDLETLLNFILGIVHEYLTHFDFIVLFLINRRMSCLHIKIFVTHKYRNKSFVNLNRRSKILKYCTQFTESEKNYCAYCCYCVLYLY